MPVISRFLGIIIMMYWDDHSPPHFHAKYSGYEITITIEDGIVEGKFPKSALRHVLRWHKLHKAELMNNWQLCQTRAVLKVIDPLE